MTRTEIELAELRLRLATIELAARYNDAQDRGDHLRARAISREHDAIVAAHSRGVR